MAYIGNAPYQGSVASINIVDGTIDTPDLKDGSVTSAKLETIAGLTSGTYGNSGTVPQIIVDSKGRITGVTSVNISSLGDTVIESSGTSAALRITQTGTGNALLVEDSANPDSTPFVVDANGSVGIGTTTPEFDLHVVGDVDPVGIYVDGYSTGNPNFQTRRALGTASSPQALTSNTLMFTFGARGYRATGWAPSSSAAIAVRTTENWTDTATGTRMLFEVTPNGSTSRTTRLELGQDGTSTFTGQAVINASGTTDALRITQTGAGNALLVEDSANPDATPFVVTGNGDVGLGTTTPLANFHAQANTSLGLVNYTAGGGTSYLFRRSSGTLTSPTVVAADNVIAATAYQGYDGTNYISAAQILAAVDGTPGTNDMPGRLIFSTTADGASSPTERMRIDSAGRVGIGAAVFAGVMNRFTQGITGAANAFSVVADGTVQSDVTSFFNNFRSAPNTAAASFTVSTFAHFYANQGTFGAGSTVSSQYGFVTESSLTGATNNYGFYSDIAAGTGRWNFFANGTARNYFAGNTGIGGDSGATIRLFAGGNATGTTSQIGIRSNETIQSGVTASYIGVDSLLSTQATAFTLTSYNAYRAGLAALGAGSAVTTVTGFNALANLAVGTNNYAFRGQFASAANTFNIYMDGTATNFFGGNTIISVADNTNAALRITQTGTGNALLVEDSANPDATPFVVDASGNVGIGDTSPSSAGAKVYITDSTSTGPVLVARNSTTDANGVNWYWDKVRTSSIVTSGDVLARFNYRGYDGANFIVGARIEAAVDGIPGTNDMPGRLVFSTTADGASSPTEHLRITNNGNIGIGTTNPTGRLEVNGTVYITRQDVSTQHVVIANSAGGNFIIAESSTSNPKDFVIQASADSNELRLNNLSNNPISFYTNNSYRMRISGDGVVSIGGTGAANYGLITQKHVTGSVDSYGIASQGQVQSDVTTLASYFRSSVTKAAGFTLTDLRHYDTNQGTLSGTVTNQYGFYADATLTGATNDYGFYSNIASGTGRWNFYANGTADNYFAGNVGIGTTTPGYKLEVNGGFFATTLNTSGAITSTLATGTAPFTITSTTRVSNLNVATAGTADTWTTARTITIGSTGKSVNGSANISWTLAEITGTAAQPQFGSLGIGTAASGTTGEIRATNNITAYYSDERLKTFHGKITNALNKVSNINGYYFTENEQAKTLGYNNNRMQVGVSAQEVERILPEIVTAAPIDNNYKTIWYDKLIPLLIEAIKELKTEVDQLKAR